MIYSKFLRQLQYIRKFIVSLHFFTGKNGRRTDTLLFCYDTSTNISFSNLYFAISRTFLDDVLFLVGTQIPRDHVLYVVPNICGSSSWDLLYFILLAPRIWKWHLDFLGNFWRPVIIYCLAAGYISSSLRNNNIWITEFSLYSNLPTSLPYCPIFYSLCLSK